MIKSDFVSDKVLAVYDQSLLERVVIGTIYDKYGQSKTIKANSNTKKGFAMRYKNILPTTTPLSEYNGTVKAPVKIVREEVEYEVAHYGDHIEYTDELDLYDFRKIQTDFLDVLGDHASISMETVRRDSLRGGSNVVYGGAEVARLGVCQNAAAIVDEDIKTTILKLKAQGAKKFSEVISGSNKVGTTPVRSAFIGVCSIYGTEDVRSLTGWKDVEDYADYSKRISEKEVGAVKDIRFVESDNDEGIVAVGDALTLATSVSILVPGDAGYDAAITASNETVILEQTLVMGKDAYATTTVRGKQGIKTIIKPIGSAGANDPLDQFGTIGWKAILGCAILNQAWLVRIEHVSPDSVTSTKHYYDYT